MITVYKYKENIPYSLHDMKLYKIERIGNLLKLYFEDGYISCTEPYSHVNGNISIEEVDFDFSHVHLLSKNGKEGIFIGKKLALLDFLDEYKKFSFEVIDESYGYNQVTYSGFLDLPKKKHSIDLMISIYYLGNIVYETE